MLSRPELQSTDCCTPERYRSMKIASVSSAIKGKKILLVDCFQLLPVDQLIELAALVPATVTAQPLGSVLLLADFTGADVRSQAAWIDEAFAGVRPSLPETFRLGGDRSNLPQDFLRTPEIFFATGFAYLQDARRSFGLAGGTDEPQRSRRDAVATAVRRISQRAQPAKRLNFATST